MPYTLNWQGADAILHLALEDPLTEEDLGGLREDLMPIITENESLLVLADLQHFDFALSFQRLLAATDGIPLPQLTSHARTSRVAIVGGGPAISMIFSLMATLGDPAYQDAVKTFSDTTTARAWLQSTTA